MYVRVLLVDDVEDVRALVRTALKARGLFEIVGEAADGRSAIALAARTEPEIVVLDLSLPDLAGHDLVVNIKRAAPTAKVVVFTGTEIPDEKPVRDAVDAYVVKSADLDYLVDLIADIVQATDPAESASLELDATEASSATARRFVRQFCEEWGLSPLTDAALVVVSELVTNAIVHARSSCEVRLIRKPNVLRIEVVDSGVGVPDVLDPDVESEGGRGMLLTSAYSAAWGVDSEPAVKVVWAELPLLPEQAAERDPDPDRELTNGG